MIKNKIKRVSPVWLASTWESRKKETVKCVEAAIEKLREADRYVTLTSIRDEVRLLFGRSLSTNTINRNECAYQLYFANRCAPRSASDQEPLDSRIVCTDGTSKEGGNTSTGCAAATTGKGRPYRASHGHRGSH